MKNKMKRTLTRILGTALLPLFLVTSPIKAEEVKTIRYNDLCTATYSLNKTEDRYNIYKVECDNGVAFYNPDGDDKIDKLCDNRNCYGRNNENEEAYEFFDRLIKPNREISRGIMISEIEEMSNKSDEMIHKDQPPVKLDEIGKW